MPGTTPSRRPHRPARPCTPTAPWSTNRTPATTGYRLRSREPERARTVCLNQAGIENVTLDGDELRFSADEESVAALSIALGQARVPITQLMAETASLEDLFLGLTGGDSSDHDREAVAS